MWHRMLHVNRKVTVGDFVTVSRKITQHDVEEFSRISGDINPIHAGAKGIVHGAFLNALVSAVIGTRLPGPGTKVVSQTLRFPSECVVNDTVTITVNLESVRKLYQVSFKCKCEDRVVLEGNAKLVPPFTHPLHKIVN